jgi:two-component system sensor histidine kinase YesM
MQPVLKRLRNVTFRKRILVIFLVSSLAPLISLGFISSWTIDSIIGNKVESVHQSNLKQDMLMLKNTLNNMNHVSQQLAFGGSTNRLIEQLNAESDPYERLRLGNEIKNELNVITFSNPNIGLLFYYYPRTGEIRHENFRIRGEFDPAKLPVLEKYSDITYYGPHLTHNGSIHQYVFSIMRKVNLLDDQEVYLYIESGRNALESTFAPLNEKTGSRRMLLLDEQGRIAFSELPEQFPVDARFPEADPEKPSGYTGHYFWNREVSNQGWSLVSLIPEQELNRERNRWLVQLAGTFTFFFFAAMLLAWVIWKMVYRPLVKFNKEINELIQSNVQEPTELMHIPEFDFLLHQIRSMKGRIWALYEEIEAKEKRRADLEVEKLRYQINPHFLMNTLDTVHWLALMNGQQEIDKLVLSLNKLLNYNLRKMGEMSTIGEEIDALKEYLQLQQIRYDFQFDVDIDADEDSLALRCPRFILQPLVENALYHGVSDDGYIYVGVKLQDDSLCITIQDNGAGMAQETVDRLLGDETGEYRQVGMGIGMRYVRRILASSYGGEAQLQIRSGIGQGTVVSLRLPATGGGQAS